MPLCHRRLTALLSVVATVVVLATPALSQAAPPRVAEPAPGPAGLPAQAPPAAFAAPGQLAAPPRTDWPFPAAFPATMGSGRLAAGALEWQGFVYDDHGANGVPVAAPVSDLAPPVGTYVYPPGPARGNGADIFRAGIGLHAGMTYWRVDWNTLVDPAVPVAEWGWTTGAVAGVRGWPGGAGVTTPESRYLLVSSRGAWLVTGAGAPVPVAALGGRLVVDRAAKSFLVMLPARRLAARGRWQVRLVAGLANPAGNGFAPVGESLGARPGGPAVYDVGFRSYAQEVPHIQPPAGPAGVILANPHDPYTPAEDAGIAFYDHGSVGNFWNEAAQAFALAAGSVAPFSVSLPWSQLAAGRTTPQVHPTGYSVRYYVAGPRLGTGVATPATDTSPTFLGRVQPYSVYVPTGYRPGQPTPLTWVLHSLGVNDNQYAVLSPDLLAQACQSRHSICATTEDRGGGGWYHGVAEVDFWSVWRALATSFTLDTSRTVLMGYSMGGYAAYKLGLEYPDLFAKAVALAGPPVCGIRVYGPLAQPGGTGTCATDGNTTPLITNARWLPYQMADGAADEEVPVTGVAEQIAAFAAAGNRYAFQLYPAEDHLVFAVQDGFASVMAQLGDPVRVTDPGAFRYTFYPNLVQPGLGIGPTRDYWVTGLRGRNAAPGVLASVAAASGELPTPAVTSVRRVYPVVNTGDASPSLEQTQTWRRGAIPRRRPVLTVTLSNIAAATVGLAGAGWRPGEAGVVTVTSDGAAGLALTGLAPGERVRLPDGALTRAGRDGVLAIRLARGVSRVRLLG